MMLVVLLVVIPGAVGVSFYLGAWMAREILRRRW